ncbi:MAG: methionyl-tRNA formyltransferase [Phycisphaerales bacterium]
MIADGRPMRIVFMGSGAFGVPTLRALADASSEFDVRLVATAPDRPAGRGLQSTPNPIAAEAGSLGLPIHRTADVNARESLEAIEQASPEAIVVIAFGQKIGPEIRDRFFAINLHASLLPAYRGAAPIQRALMAGESTTGLSIIGIAARMDAGEVFDILETPIDLRETAGELHDRLAELGPELVTRTLRRHRAGLDEPQPQDEALATHAAKISRADAVVDFGRSASSLRGWIHGLSPRPGCTITLPLPSGLKQIRLLRVEAVSEAEAAAVAGLDAAKHRAGTFVEPGLVRCGEGFLHPLEVQPAGGRVMDWDDFLRGHAVASGLESASP